MTVHLAKATVIDIPTEDSIYPSSGLVVPGRYVDGQDAVCRVSNDTLFMPAGSHTWDSKYYDGLRVLLAKFPPPIHLPRSVAVERLDRLPGEDRQLEGKRWTLTWTDTTAEVIVNDQAYPVRCSFTVYHKYDKVREEANWRIYAVITPKRSSSAHALGKLDRVELRLSYDGRVTTKESALTVGPNPRKNNLVRPRYNDSEDTERRYSYVILSAGEFEWVTPERESFARARKRADPVCADLLEREHFRTSGHVYRFVPRSSATWFAAELRDAALIGIPRCSLLVPISKDSVRFLSAVAERFRYTAGAKAPDAHQLCEWHLPAFADSVEDFDRPEACGRVNSWGGGR